MPLMLSMDNSLSLDLDGIIAEVKNHCEELSNHSWAEAKTLYQIQYKALLALTGKHRDDFCT